MDHESLAKELVRALRGRRSQVAFSRRLGFRTNVVGTRELLARVREAGPDVHYVHISTAYVAGRRRGSGRSRLPRGRVAPADLQGLVGWWRGSSGRS